MSADPTRDLLAEALHRVHLLPRLRAWATTRQEPPA